MESKASAVWTGSLKEGNGTISTGSGVISDAPYTFKARFEGAKGTSPEELIGAAHASCFSMAFGAELGKVGITPEKIETSAVVVLGKQGEGFGVMASKLSTLITAPGADHSVIEKAAAGAKENCPISKLLNAEITLDLKIA